MTHVNHHALTAQYISEIKPHVFMDEAVETDGMVQNIYRCCPSAAFVDETVVREMIAVRASAIHMVVVVLGGGVYEDFKDYLVGAMGDYALIASLMAGNTLTKDLPLNRDDFQDIITVFRATYNNAQLEADAPENVESYYVFPVGVRRNLRFVMRFVMRNTPLALLIDHPNLYGVLCIAGAQFPTDVPDADIELLIAEVREEILSEEICNRLDSMDSNILEMVLGNSIAPNLDVVNTINARLDAFGVYMDEFPLSIVRATIGAYWEGYTGLELPGALDEPEPTPEPVDEFAACTEGFLSTINLTNPSVPESPAVDLLGELMDVIDRHTADVSDEGLETIAMAFNAVVEEIYPTTPLPPPHQPTFTKHHFEFTSEYLISELINLGALENVDVVSVSEDGIDFTISHPFYPQLAPQQFITVEQVKTIIIQVIYKLRPSCDDFKLTEFSFDSEEETFKGVLIIKD